MTDLAVTWPEKGRCSLHRSRTNCSASAPLTPRSRTTYSKVENWGVHVVTDGLLITGQNPASSGPTAKVLINALRTQ
jgi:putative intracellular protease/amidase